MPAPLAPLALLFPLVLSLIQADDPGPPPSTQPGPVELEEIVITATRSPRDPFDVAGTAGLLDAETLRSHISPRSLPDALAEVPGVMVQKTSYGQASPFIRGLTGFHTLALVDGVRLNNSVMRAGPNQYWTTVDVLALERLELVRGPGAVLYGSDAVAGVAQALYPDPKLGGEGIDVGGFVHTRYASAEDSYAARVQAEGRIGPDFGFVVGTTRRHFSDYTAGRHQGLQPETGYGASFADAKLAFRVSEDARLIVAHQAARLDDVPRTHRTIFGSSWHGTTVGDELRRRLDQSRDLSYARIEIDGEGPGFDRARLTLSYQHQGEDRDRIRSDGRRDLQGFDVRTLGVEAQAELETSIGQIVYGGDFYRDGVNSFRTDYNADGTLKGEAVQGPVADDGRYDLAGLFIQDRIPLSDAFELTAGIRHTRVALDANRVQDPETGAAFALSDSWTATVGDVRLSWYPSETLHPYFLVAQGFRAPNLSDLTRFDSQRSGEIETPAPGLDPERFLTFELGAKSRGETFDLDASYFATLVRDFIVRTPTGATIDGEAEVTKKNSGSGLIHGIELGGRYRMTRAWSLFAGMSWLAGRVKSFPTSSPEKNNEPIDRMPPLGGHLGARFAPPDKGYFLEALIEMVDAQTRLSSRDRADTQRIPPGGTPGYTVYTLRGGVEVAPRAQVTAAIENLTDRDYRVHGSGQNEPGTNVILGFTLEF